jgi:4-hydroxybenzoate polyprenyltransferase
MVGLAPPVGSLATGQGWWGLIPGVGAFLLHIPLEMIKDLRDMPGDRLANQKTLPIVSGENLARRISQAFLIILLPVLSIPAIAGWLNPEYLAVAMPGVGIPSVILIKRLNSQLDTAGYHSLIVLLKWGVVLGLLALLIG